jgi:hypothetical protein
MDEVRRECEQFAPRDIRPPGAVKTRRAGHLISEKMFHAVTLFTGGLRREALTGLLTRQAAEQSCLADAGEERPRRELTGVHRAVRNKLAENRQRFVILAKEQLTGCLEV